MAEKRIRSAIIYQPAAIHVGESPMPGLAPILLMLLAADPEKVGNAAPTTERFEAAKYGLTLSVPKAWPIAAREEADRVFVALIPQADMERPGVVACELGLAPENL